MSLVGDNPDADSRNAEFHRKVLERVAASMKSAGLADRTRILDRQMRSAQGDLASAENAPRTVPAAIDHEVKRPDHRAAPVGDQQVNRRRIRKRPRTPACGLRWILPSARAALSATRSRPWLIPES